MRSLTWKLSLAFLVVSIAGAVVAAIFVNASTQRGFQTVVQDRAASDFLQRVTDYYQSHNDSWTGVQTFLAMQGQQGGGPPPQGPPNQGQPGSDQPPQGAPDGPPPPFILCDASGKVIAAPPSSHYTLQQQVAASVVAQGRQVTVGGKEVGIIFSDGSPPPLSPAEQTFLSVTQQALIYGSLAAFLIALAIGIMLARSLTRPVRELTTALHAMGDGSLQQQVPVRSRDELGDLSRTFNQMSNDLALANQQRRQMTADIAHDLRNPVTVISGYMEALRDGVLSPTPDRFAVLYDEAQRLQRLIEDLRTLLLADAGELRLHPQPTEPAALLSHISATYMHAAEQHAVTLAVKANPALEAVELDNERMVQVLGNLVSNALRYTPAGGTITLSADPMPKGVQLRVQDTGQGIMPDVLPRIFDRFYRADRARAQSQGETGLGLAIAKAIVEAHGGTINATSEPGAGATFTITLPA